MRPYTVKEIDELRYALDLRFLYGTTYLPKESYQSRAYTTEQRNSAVEAAVKTHMLAGHTAQDIYDSDAKGQL